MHEGFRQAIDPVQALKEEAAKDFHDGVGVGRGKRQELAIGRQNAVGNRGMGNTNPS